MNEFGKEFFNLLEKRNNFIFFPEEKTMNFYNNGNEYKIETVILDYSNFDKELINNCYKIADVKSRKTMDFNQAGKKRILKEKIMKQFRGVLAETIVHLYLYYRCNIDKNNIKRYDIERESFEYSQEEYDVNVILNNNKIITLEIRSSNNPYKNISDYLSNRGIKYVYFNEHKKKEKFRDLAIAVIYDLENHTGQLGDKQIEKFFNNLKDKKYKIYLITHCATIRHLKKGQYIVDSLKQNNTQYLEVPFYYVADNKYNIRNIFSSIK